MKHPVDSLEGGLQGDCERSSLTCVLEVTWDVAPSSRSPCEQSLQDSGQGTGLTHRPGMGMIGLIFVYVGLVQGSPPGF